MFNCTIKAVLAVL